MTTAVIFVAGPIPDLDQLGRRMAPGPSAVPVMEEVSSGLRADVSTSVPSQDLTGGAGDRSTLGDRLRCRIAARGPAFSVAADGGLDLALRLGHTPELVIGDMDSVSDRAMGVARDSGSTISIVPRAKDVSDFELALDEAVGRGASHLVVVGGTGGRLDHVLATVLTLTSQKYSGLVLEALLVDNYVAILHGEGRSAPAAAARDVDTPAPSAVRGPSTASMEGMPGDPISLFAIGGPAVGVRTAGLAWPLAGETLTVGTSRGVSNELIGDRGSVSIEKGCLAVVRTARYEPSGGNTGRSDIDADAGDTEVER